MAETELLNIEWRLPEWIMHNGGVLTFDNVMDYFSLSPFWDPNSNNAVIKMQTTNNSIDQANMDLTKMTGIEFVILKHDILELEGSSLFVIQKQRRSSPDDVVPIALYYILNGNIYQCPDLYSVLANRTMTSLYHLMSAFKESSQAVNFLPFRGYRWNNDPQFSGENKNTKLNNQQIQNYRNCAGKAFFKAMSLPTEPTPKPKPKQVAQTEAGKEGNENNQTEQKTGAAAVKKELNDEEKPSPKPKRKKTGDGTRAKRKKSQADQTQQP